MTVAGRGRANPTNPTNRAHDLVVVSLEPWDDVWRRNQHLVAGLLRQDTDLRVLFVEPPADPVHDVRRRVPAHRGHLLREVGADQGAPAGRLWTVRPTKWLPRRIDPHGDARRARAVRTSASRLSMAEPVLWINDPGGVVLLRETGWPSLYDITDDWLQAARDPREHARLAAAEHELLERCAQVVVCSNELARTKGAHRPVVLVQNAVDVALYRTPAPRPDDLPAGPCAVYVGTLHSDRIDVRLCVETAQRLARERAGGRLVLVGPVLLDPRDVDLLERAGVALLGARPARTVPGYLQHAAALVVPHVVDGFTDTLDPIKLYEYLAVDRPIISTPVAGFRDDLSGHVELAGPESFPAAVAGTLAASTQDAVEPRSTRAAAGAVPDWSDRVRQMADVLTDVRGVRAARTTPTRR